MKTNNNLLIIQETIMRQIKRLDDDKLDNQELSNEIARSNALSNNAMTFIKSVNVGIRVREIAEKQGTTVKSLNKELGLENE